MPCKLKLPEPWQGATKTVFAGGLTNRHWLLECATGKALLRENNAAVELGIDRAAEQRIWQQASQTAVSPALIYQQGRWSLSAFVDAPTGAADSAAKLRALLGAISWLQGQSVALPVLDCQARAKALAADSLGPRQAYQYLAAHPLPYRPAHVDLNPQNCLWQGERLWLIDWEYASLADPYYDFAALMVDHQQSAERIAAMWQQLTGQGLSIKRLWAMAAVYSHLCESWCLHPQAGYLAYAAHYRKAWASCLVAMAAVD
ncbi:choline/ethanolamine kinase family protein [Gallaecimonas mangrovi]|uniref:choline/ethanolamine kinase family protein n=1 Tax=Gallaecimonas mangrovi TaxID=2291597 RepID=UPI0018670CF8|nr:choline/ethanolamine kinase family protein [Gallaecimonas mangrovi]